MSDKSELQPASDTSLPSNPVAMSRRQVLLAGMTVLSGVSPLLRGGVLDTCNTVVIRDGWVLAKGD